jgi:PQQ-like domain/Domain of unknown function (DUF5122) beta-propeller
MKQWKLVLREMADLCALRAGVVAAIAVAIAAGGAGTSGASSPSLPAEAPIASLVTDQDIHAIVVGAGTVYAAGDINYVGARSGGFALLDERSGRLSSTGWPAVLGGSVEDAVPDGAGGWLVAGSFTSVGTRPCAGFARLRASGTLDVRFCHHVEGPVLALARAGSRIYLGGSFRRVDGRPRLRLAALELRSGALTSWQPVVTGRPFNDRGNLTYPYIDSLEVVGDRLFVGGFFARVAGAARGSLAAFHAGTGALSSWRADMGGADAAPGIAMTIAGGALYVARLFSTLAGKPSSELGAVSAATGARLPWTPRVNGQVSGLAVVGDRVFLVGDFTRVDGVARSHVAAVDASTGALEAAFRPPPINGGVDAATVTQHALYVSGDVDNGTGTAAPAALDPRTGSLLAWTPPRANAPFGVLRVANGQVAIGGELASIGGEQRYGLVAIDERTGLLSSWAPKLDGLASALAVTGGRLYVGGSFRHVNGVPRKGLAAFDLATGELTDWAPSLEPYDDLFVVSRLATDSATLYVSGDFARANGIARERLAAFDAATGSLRTWNPKLVGEGANGHADIGALQAAFGRVYVAGGLEQVGGLARNGVAEVDATSGAVTPWNPAHNGLYGITALYRLGDTLYVGGDFSHFDGAIRHGLAAVDARSYALLPWAPALSRGWVNTQAAAITPVGSLIGVVGDFRQAGDAPHAAVALIDPETGRVLDWHPPASQTVSFEGTSIASDGQVLAFDGYVGGNADTINVYRLGG